MFRRRGRSIGEARIGPVSDEALVRREAREGALQAPYGSEDRGVGDEGSTWKY